MRIRFIGVGSQFSTQEQFHSNILLTAGNGERMLIDCGSDARFSLAESRINATDISAVYVSHLHNDHVGGLEWFALSTFFSANKTRPVLIAEEVLMADIWDHSLRGGLQAIEGRSMSLEDYFECRAVRTGEPFNWEGITFSIYMMPHIHAGSKDHYSYGLLINDSGKSVFITTDTQFEPGLITSISKEVAMIFHDCETAKFKTTVHAHYDDLRTLPEAVKAKMWLYHYQQTSHIDPLKDGFLGFVTKGQEFVI